MGQKSWQPTVKPSAKEYCIIKTVIGKLVNEVESFGDQFYTWFVHITSNTVMVNLNNTWYPNANIRKNKRNQNKTSQLNST